MVRITTASSALLIAASALSLSEAALEYKMRVRNLTHQQPFSPLLIFAHTEEIQGFQVGDESSAELRTLAEEGDLSDLLALADDEDVAPFLCGYTLGSENMSPGGEEFFTLEVDEKKCPKDVYLTVISMLVNTNDAFMGIDTLQLKKKGGLTKVYPPAFDAGTEENNELCTHIPGPACSATSGNAQAEPGEGYIQVHRGFHGVGGELEADDYDWRNPVAEVLIFRSDNV